MVDRELVYTPTEVARYTLDELGRRRSGGQSGVQLGGLAQVNAKLTPLRPGELTVIIGRPSHYKSGLAQWWARQLAHSCLGTEEVVVYGTCEMAIEELGLYDLAVDARLDALRVAQGRVTDAEWERLQAASMKRSALPLWLLGHSLARRRKRVRMSVYTIERALFWIEDNMDFRARIVFLDYLNMMVSERRRGQEPSRRVDVSEIVQCAKDLALSLGCPVVMLAQAHRRVDDREWQLPQMNDAMESAAIEQYSDKMLSVWMPKVTRAIGSEIRVPRGEPLIVGEGLLILGLLKQKNGPAGGWWPLHVQYGTNEISMMDAEPVRAVVPF